MKIIRFAIFLVLITTPTHSRDFRPETHFENLPRGDSSIQQCVVFRTTAGVRYTVESSTDMMHWVAEESFYGVGNEYVTTLREYTPPPPPPPGTPPYTPPTPARAASVRLQRAASSTVASWASLDHGGPVVVSIAIQMDPGWTRIPLFWDRYGAYNFFICHPTGIVLPPVENSLLGINDSAMLATLEANLPTMNQQVADSVARSRNAPPPGPPEPGSRKFLRLLVDPTCDTDADGSPDWAEFEIATSGTGSMVAGVIGDAFNPDSNGDSVPDGDQLDADQDGTADAKDPDAAENTAFIPLGPVPRYALFPITKAKPPADTLQALQINDNGRVLYVNGTWCGGTWTPLVAPAELTYEGNPQTAFGVSINDNDVILGNSGQHVGTLPPEFASVRCFWKTPAASPQLVKSDENLAEGYAGGLTESIAFSGDNYRPQLSNDNRFTARSCHWEVDPNGNAGKEVSESAVWTLPADGQLLSTHAAIEPSILFHSTGISWGYTAPRDAAGIEIGARKGQVLAPDPLPALPFIPYNAVTVAGRIMAFPVNTVLPPQALLNGQWQDSTFYKGAFDMASDGTAVGSSDFHRTASILLGGNWLGIGTAAPGLPSEWIDSSTRLLDITPGGWILVGRGNTVPPIEHAVMLPITVDGVDPDYVAPAVPQGAPPVEPPEYLAGGVDRISMTALKGSGRVPEMWIMAPNGGTANTVRFRSPLNDVSTLTLTSNSNV